MRNNQLGRSMIEMLGVLAIVGVLSVVSKALITPQAQACTLSNTSPVHETGAHACIPHSCTYCSHTIHIQHHTGDCLYQGSKLRNTTPAGADVAFYK